LSVRAFAHTLRSVPRERKKTAPTIDDVAAVVGVSRSTVSRAFSRPELISEEVVAAIHKAAAKLQYQPHQTARALSTGKHGNLAIVVPDIANPFFPPLIRAAQMTADGRGMSLFVGDSNEDPVREHTLLSRLMLQTEGLVLASSRMKDERILEMAARNRIVLINRDVPGIARVLIETATAVEAGVDQLVKLGHKKVAYVGGPQASWSEVQRKGAVKKAAARHGIAVESLKCDPATFEAAEAMAAAVVASKATAVVAFDDLMAHGLLAGFSALGVQVPGDVSVIGCDDVLASKTYPALTTVASRHVEAGRLSVEILLGMIESGTQSDVRIVLESKLVERSTTGVSRGGRKVGKKVSG